MHVHTYADTPILYEGVYYKIQDPIDHLFFMGGCVRGNKAYIYRLAHARTYMHILAHTCTCMYTHMHIHPCYIGYPIKQVPNYHRFYGV